MATTIDWGTKVINVPRADMLLLQTTPIEVRQLNINDFRKDLMDLNAQEQGIWADTTHNHYPPLDVGGVTLARVVEIINDYTVTFEDGQYAVNLVGANSNIADVVNINNVSVRSANSAGLQDLESLQAASFSDAVAVKVSSIYSGTTFPVGTGAYPVNNLTDANTIASDRGFVQFRIMESMTLDSGTDLSDGHTVFSDNPVSILLTVDPNIDVTNVNFENASIQGTLDGGNVFRQCAIYDVDYVYGFIHECSLFGTVTIGGTSQTALFMDCYSGIPGGGPGEYPEIDMGGAGVTTELAVRNYSGGLGIKNCTEAGSHSIDLASGRVVFDATVTNGTFYVRGVGHVEDNSTGSAVVVDKTLTQEVEFTRKLVDADETLTADGTWTIIDSEDGTTVLRTRQVTDVDDATIDLPTGVPARRVKTS